MLKLHCWTLFAGSGTQVNGSKTHVGMAKTPIQAGTLELKQSVSKNVSVQFSKTWTGSPVLLPDAVLD
jgi:hypothetical protein